jgi:hypothetical protein
MIHHCQESRKIQKMEYGTLLETFAVKCYKVSGKKQSITLMCAQPQMQHTLTSTSVP